MNKKIKVTIKEENLDFINSLDVSLQYLINKSIEDIKKQYKKEKGFYQSVFSVNFEEIK